jgi:hypothetical protein
MQNIPDPDLRNSATKMLESEKQKLVGKTYSEWRTSGLKLGDEKYHSIVLPTSEFQVHMDVLELNDEYIHLGLAVLAFDDKKNYVGNVSTSWIAYQDGRIDA